MEFLIDVFNVVHYDGLNVKSYSLKQWIETLKIIHKYNKRQKGH